MNSALRYHVKKLRWWSRLYVANVEKGRDRSVFYMQLTGFLRSSFEYSGKVFSKRTCRRKKFLDLPKNEHAADGRALNRGIVQSTEQMA